MFHHSNNNSNYDSLLPSSVGSLFIEVLGTQKFNLLAFPALGTMTLQAYHSHTPTDSATDPSPLVTHLGAGMWQSLALADTVLVSTV